jgi:hypothetical protein
MQVAVQVVLSAGFASAATKLASLVTYPGLPGVVRAFDRGVTFRTGNERGVHLDPTRW